MGQARPKMSADDLRFWFLWLVATTVGLTIGMTIRQLLFRWGAWATSPVWVGAIIGLALGIAQLRTLNWKWILATTVGWAVGWPLGWYVGWNILSDLGLIAVFAGIGAIAGGLGAIRIGVGCHRIVVGLG